MMFRDKFLAPLAQVLDRFEEMPFPIIAAISGHAVGGGCELALSADLRIMSFDAILALPEVQLGATPGAGGVQKLIRHVGRSRALEWILLGSRVTAQQAMAAGLLMEVTDVSALMDRALAVAEQVASFGPRAIAMSNPFRYFNSSPEVIRLVVMMYVRYPLSLRNVEDLLAERGIDISHETVRFWWNRFGPMFAAEIRKKRVAHMRGYPQWRWHLDEVFVKVNGKLCYLWRAVDHEGEVLEAVVTAKRDKAAALKFLKRIMKKYGRPRKIVTDGLCSYSAAMKEIGNADRHEVGRRLNNRAENSHQPFRRRERAMQRFRSMKTLQKFSSVHAQVHNHFNQERHLVTRQSLQTETLCRIGRVARSRGAHFRGPRRRCGGECGLEEEVAPGGGARLLRLFASMSRRHGSLRDRPLLGARDRGARTRCASYSTHLCESLRGSTEE
jgi:putative transposase